MIVSEMLSARLVCYPSLAQKPSRSEKRDGLERKSLLIYEMALGTHQLPSRIEDNERALPLMLHGNEGNVEGFVQNYI